MKLRKSISALLAAALLLGGCGKPVEKKEEALPTDQNYSVLFIGNSYTFYNKMPVIFQNVARAAGYEVETQQVVKGGYYLWKYLYIEADRALVDEQLLGEKKYDFVILQDNSTGSLGNNNPLFNRAVREFDPIIRTHGAAPVLYSTWGRKTGSTTLEKNGWTNESMTWDIANAYQTIGTELDIPVAHVGLAFYDVYTGDSGIELYDEDLTHPSYAGSYLAAMTLFAKMFRVDPTTIAYDGDLTPETAAVLREAARKAVFETPEIPAEPEPKTHTILPVHESVKKMTFFGRSSFFYQNHRAVSAAAVKPTKSAISAAGTA